MDENQTAETPAAIAEERIAVVRLSYINRKAVKEMALKLSRDTRANTFTRVSKQFLDECNDFLVAHIRHKVHSAPTVGKTL